MSDLVEDRLGIVVIGRNEGQRLIACLESLQIFPVQIIYVDSGSTDNSVIEAESRGVQVSHLDVSDGFTAARARNSGYHDLVKLNPELELVQFIDGDCVLQSEWIAEAIAAFNNSQQVAVVCGRRREIYPIASVYNQLCDIEWNSPIGESLSCGGDFMIRTSVFNEVGGFRETLIAGEEPELCFRIRSKGWKVVRIDREMTLHDANIHRFSQWWHRNVRSGHAFAEATYLHGDAPEFNWKNRSLSIFTWALVIPIVLLVGSAFTYLFWPGWLVYPAQIIRIALRERNKLIQNWAYAAFVTLGKFPQMQGQLKFLWNRLFEKRSSIIEYK